MITVKYSRDVLAGALGNFTLELNNNNRISFKNIININSSDYLIDRYNGRDFILGPGRVTPSGRRRSVFAKIHSSTRKLVGEHNIKPQGVRLLMVWRIQYPRPIHTRSAQAVLHAGRRKSHCTILCIAGAGSSQKSGKHILQFPE